jgi:small subunit ribosomal protein S11
MANEVKKQETKTTDKAKSAKPKAKKKKKLASVNGMAHIHATVNNTIITFTDEQGNAIT